MGRILDGGYQCLMCEESTRTKEPIKKHCTSKHPDKLFRRFFVVRQTKEEVYGYKDES